MIQINYSREWEEDNIYHASIKFSDDIYHHIKNDQQENIHKEIK